MKQSTPTEKPNKQRGGQTQIPAYFEDTLKRLREKTQKCRIDMHEPDEQDIYAVVTGTHLDNAMGEDPCHNCCEYTVGLGDSDGNGRQWFNLSDLIALARMASAPALLRSNGELKTAVQFLMSQVKQLAERSFSEDVEGWLGKCDAMNCGRIALGSAETLTAQGESNE